MNEDAFARRFYADRAELDSLGIQLTVDRPADGAAEQENYSLRPENFHLPAIEFTDDELAALQFALSLLDGEFAYAEPLRLALQQITWGRPSPLEAPDQRSLALGITASAGGHELSGRLAKIETAIFRHKTITFDYFTIARDEVGSRKVDPYHLLFRGSQFYLLGYCHDREAIRVFRLTRIQGKVAYATKAEHDFKRPDDFDPRAYAKRADWQFGEEQGVAEILVSERLAWQVERHFGRFGEIRKADSENEMLFTTPYASSRMVISFVLGLGEHARIAGPPELVAETEERIALIQQRHDGEMELAVALPSTTADGEDGAEAEEIDTRPDVAIRPERFARLVTLASILISSGRAGATLQATDVCEQVQITREELAEDIAVLNVVNFGGGSYVLYAELADDGTIEVDPEPYADNFDRPARLLPVEAKALIAAIDLIGDHMPEGTLTSAREKIVAALGADPLEQGLQVADGGADDSQVARVVSKAIAAGKMLKLDYYKPNEDEFTERVVEPYALVNGREGWYVASFDPERDDVRHFRLDRVRHASVSRKQFKRRPEVNPSADVEGWPKTGELPASNTALIWISPERARWAREESTVVEELADGAVLIETTYAGRDWLVREVLKEAGDAAVIKPVAARKAVLSAVRKLRTAARA